MIIDKNGAAIEAAEAAASEIVEGVRADLKLTRRVLTADELCGMKDLRPRLEKQIDLRTIDGTRQHVFLFSIDGILSGGAVTGALFAGECMMVPAKSFEIAYKTARDGLHDTVELLHEDFANRVAEDAMVTSQGLERMEAGRRMRSSAPGRELQTLPKLKALMATEIGGLPWKW